MEHVGKSPCLGSVRLTLGGSQKKTHRRIIHRYARSSSRNLQNFKTAWRMCLVQKFKASQKKKTEATPPRLMPVATTGVEPATPPWDVRAGREGQCEGKKKRAPSPPHPWGKIAAISKLLKVLSTKRLLKKNRSGLAIASKRSTSKDAK